MGSLIQVNVDVKRRDVILSYFCPVQCVTLGKLWFHLNIREVCITRNIDSQLSLFASSLRKRCGGRKCGSFNFVQKRSFTYVGFKNK